MAQKFDYGLCIVCNEGIYNPLCPNCISNEIIAWLSEKNETLAKEFRKKGFVEDIDGGRCAVCNENSSYICPYCFTRQVMHWLKAKAGKKIVREFLEVFNFDFEHCGYA